MFLINSLLYPHLHAQTTIEKNFLNPPASAKPLVSWYWLNGVVSKEGITADLEVIKKTGIGGVYLIPAADTSSSNLFHPSINQFTPAFWSMVKFAMQEAKRLNLQLEMNLNAGFSLAAGKWITPELSKQKLVWSKTYIKEGDTNKINLLQPEDFNNYYKDISVFAYPANCINAFCEVIPVPKVTSSSGSKVSFLAFRHFGKELFTSDSSCWIQYKYPQAYTCRSVKICTGGKNLQAVNLLVQSSDDGKKFTTVSRLEVPYHNRQDNELEVTYAIPSTTAKYYRFVYEKEVTEPGKQHIGVNEWKSSLQLSGIHLSDEPVIHQYESKNGSIWSFSKNTTEEQVPVDAAVPLKSILNITDKMDAEGNLNWTPPVAGDWVIVRMGHTSTGCTTNSEGKGWELECDMFNADAVKLQFSNWFVKVFSQTNPLPAKEVLKHLHVSNWECGSQNWSNNFPAEFKKRRGYDLMPYLLVMAGVPVQDAATSEKILYDVRKTIAELVNDVFYTVIKNEARIKGFKISPETDAPLMLGDGLLRYKHADFQTGSFYLTNGENDRLNDISNAVSDAHIYGKKIIETNLFKTEQHVLNDSVNGLKINVDRIFALGVNRVVVNTFVHNPDPSSELDSMEIYYRYNEKWQKQNKEWIDYLARCQALLQMGNPVVDIAVFTGERLPRRSLLPGTIVNTLPGFFGNKEIEDDKKNLTNRADPLNGYSYDSFSPDALLMMKVKDGRVVLPGGATYAVLVFPDDYPMNSNSHSMSLVVARKILQLLNDGAKIIMSRDYTLGTGMNDSNNELKNIINEILKPGKKGTLALTPFTDADFSRLGVEKDVVIETETDHSLAWAHRKINNEEIYFIANQTNTSQQYTIEFRDGKGMYLELWDSFSGKISDGSFGYAGNKFTIGLPAGFSFFYIFRKDYNKNFTKTGTPAGEKNNLF